jgi:hypothetical protein
VKQSFLWLTGNRTKHYSLIFVHVCACLGVSNITCLYFTRIGGTGLLSTFLVSAIKKGSPVVHGVFLDSRNRWVRI